MTDLGRVRSGQAEVGQAATFTRIWLGSGLSGPLGCCAKKNMIWVFGFLGVGCVTLVCTAWNVLFHSNKAARLGKAGGCSVFTERTYGMLPCGSRSFFDVISNWLVFAWSWSFNILRLLACPIINRGC